MAESSKVAMPVFLFVTAVWRLSKAAHEQRRLQPLVHLAVFSTSILPRRPGSLVTPITHYFRTPQYFQTHQKFRRDLLYTLHSYGFRVGSLKSSFLSHFVLCSTFFSTSCGRTLRSRVPIASLGVGPHLVETWSLSAVRLRVPQCGGAE